MAVIGEYRSALSTTRKTSGNFGNVSADVLFSKVAYQRKRWQLQSLARHLGNGKLLFDKNIEAEISEMFRIC